MTRVQEQYAKNAASLRSMLEKARESAPKKHRGYTVEQLEERVWVYEHEAAGIPMEPQTIDVSKKLLAFPLRGARLGQFQRDKTQGWS